MKDRGYLVSCVITDLAEVDNIGQIVTEIAAKFAEQYDFWEILLVIETDKTDVQSFAHQVRSIPNVRIIVINEKVTNYRARTLACSEAIGDVVVVSHAAHAASLDLNALADQAYREDIVVNYCRRHTNWLAYPYVRLLSWVSGFKITSNNLRAVAFTRLRLNEVLQGSTPDLEIRFDRNSTLRPRTYLKVPKGTKIASNRRSFITQLSVLADLLVISTPRLLSAQAFLSAFVALSALAFAVYSILIFNLKDNVVEGWLSTSLLISSVLFFLGITVGSISLGLIGIYDRLRGGSNVASIEEFNNTDFFSQMSSLNVEVSQKIKTDES